MIAFLRGRLLEKHPESRHRGRAGRRLRRAGAGVVVLRDGGAGGDIALRVHTHVREDTIALFGFSTRARAAALRTADCGQRHRAEAGARRAVGDRAATISIQAVQRADIARLTAIPGVGKKTAERIALELKDRLGAIPRAETVRRTRVGGRAGP